MNVERTGWARRYQRALRKYLAQAPGAGRQPAVGLGREAVALDMETLDVAKCHEQALMTLAPPGGLSPARRRLIERATSFFAETISPIERTHHAALESDVHILALTRTLSRRTMESSASNRRLRQTIGLRRGAETALKKSGKQHVKLLAKSHRLQQHLRKLTRRILAAQEDERQKMSSRLHDEIAQTLLAVNLMLLTLNKEAKDRAANLKKEIVNTQRIVKESAQAVDRFSHEFGIRHEK